MKKIKDILYIIGVNGMIIFFALTLVVNVFEKMNPIPKAILTMILGVITFYICKDITKILEKEVLECITQYEKKK